MNRRHTLPIASLAILVAVGIVYIALRDRTPPLTPEALEEGRRKWHASGVSSYALTLRIENPMQAAQSYELTVREGEVERFAIDGRAAPNNPAYTITGLFEILQREIELVRGTGPSKQSHAQGTQLRADFHPTLGLPRVFKRLAPGNRSTFISVTSFERI